MGEYISPLRQYCKLDPFLMSLLWYNVHLAHCTGTTCVWTGCVDGVGCVDDVVLFGSIKITRVQQLLMTCTANRLCWRHHEPAVVGTGVVLLLCETELAIVEAGVVVQLPEPDPAVVGALAGAGVVALLPELEPAVVEADVVVPLCGANPAVVGVGRSIHIVTAKVSHRCS